VPFNVIADVTFGQFFFAVLLAVALSLWVYWHASRHGSRHATAWGISAFLVVGFFAYLAHYAMTRRRF
jgi:drug/metabolite transporter (DMT)-like permease